MRGRRKFAGLVAVLLVCLARSASAFGQNVPLDALRNWMLYTDWGNADLEKGKYESAANRFTAAIRTLEPYPPHNRRLLARSYCDLAQALYQQKRYAEAEPLARWALSVRDADKKSGSDAVFQCIFTLASIHTAQKHYADAEPLLERALAIQEKELPAGHVNTLATLDRLAMVYREQKKYKQAETIYLRALAIQERQTPDENLDLADTAEAYATLLRRMNRAEDADEWQARALKIRDVVATKKARAAADAARKELRGFK